VEHEKTENHILTRDTFAQSSTLRQQQAMEEVSQTFAPNAEPPVEVLKELKSRPNAEELDHIVVVNNEQFKDHTTAALESVVEEMQKHLHVVQLAELRFTTEMALEAESNLHSL